MARVGCARGSHSRSRQGAPAKRAWRTATSSRSRGGSSSSTIRPPRVGTPSSGASIPPPRRCVPVGQVAASRCRASPSTRPWCSHRRRAARGRSASIRGTTSSHVSLVMGLPSPRRPLSRSLLQRGVTWCPTRAQRRSSVHGSTTCGVPDAYRLVSGVGTWPLVWLEACAPASPRRGSRMRPPTR